MLELNLFVCCFFIGSGAAAFAMNSAILVLGTSFGWLLGTIVSPYNPQEETQFATYTKAFSAFLSGYLVAKIDKIVEHLFSPEFLSAPEAAFRMILFLAAVVVATVFTFLNRRYADQPKTRDTSND